MMKRRLIYWFGLILLVTAALAAPQDPFQSQGTADWEGLGLQEKPYQLEIAYGEWERTEPVEGVESLSQVVEPAFLAEATKLLIATSGDEASDFQEIGKHRVRYRISENEDGSFDIQIHIEIPREGRGEYAINTSTTLDSSEWIVLGSIVGETADGVQGTLTGAVRVAPRESDGRNLRAAGLICSGGLRTPSGSKPAQPKGT